MSYWQDIDLYVTFLRPGAEPERFAYSITLRQVGELSNDLTGEWQGSTIELIERLHEKAPCIESKCLWPIGLARALITMHARRLGNHVPGPSTARVRATARLCYCRWDAGFQP
jgi:hypothetical protein